VHSADNVLLARVVDDAVREIAAEIAIAGELVGSEKADLLRHARANELL
jgi:hypothetical protein